MFSEHFRWKASWDQLGRFDGHVDYKLTNLQQNHFNMQGNA